MPRPDEEILMTILDWALVALYFVALIVIGAQTMKRIQNPDDFAVAGNRIIWPVFFGSLSAAFLGGGASIGNAGAAFSDGYVYMFAFFAFALQTLLVGWLVAPRLKQYAGAHTVGDVMDAHYGKAARLLTGLLSLGLCAGILGAQALAIGTVVNATVEIDTTLAILIGMGVVILYSTFGGAWAVIQTDMLQFVFLGVFLPIALIIGVWKAGGPAEMAAGLPDLHTSFLGAWTWPTFLSVFVAFLLGETLVPPYAQRTFATPDSRHARLGFMLSGVFAFGFFFIAASLGMVALSLFPDIEPDQALPTIVMELLPVGLVGLLVAALLAVVMSTASSYLNSIAVVFTKDIYLPFVDPDLSSSRRLWIERALSVMVGAAATVFALTVPSIVDALLYSYSLWAPTVIIPLLAAVLLGIRSAPAAVAAILVGGLVTAVWTWGVDEPFGVTGLVAGVAANLVTFVAVIATTGSGRSTAPVMSATTTSEEVS
jgi:SSS family solute:Na+ symporter